MQTSAETIALQQQLKLLQNPDGGWGYHGNPSWTEPTAFSLLALSASGDAGNENARRQAISWLTAAQRQDGGWSPQHGVAVSTWVTSLATLALLSQDWKGTGFSAALRWLRSQVKTQNSPADRLVSRLRSGSSLADAGLGSSWFPGTAAWLYPTSLSVITFLQAQRTTGQTIYGDLARQGQQFILARRCRDGGWNHGGARYLSEDAFSYPEMTGMALLALGGVDEAELAYPLKRAAAMAAQPTSSEGLSWLRLGLARHQVAPSDPVVTPRARTTQDLALQVLAATAHSPRNFLVSAH